MAPCSTTSGRTHRVVTRAAWASDETVTDWVAVENIVIDVAMQYGTAVHLSVDGPNLESLAPGTLATVRRLTRLREADRRLADRRYPEYRATLPDDAALVRECLNVTDGASGGMGGWRAYDVREISVVAHDEWLYHSIPHHEHDRDVRPVVDGYLDALDAALDTVPGSAVFPVGPLRSWRSGSVEYELGPEYLRIDSPEHRSVGHSLELLDGITPHVDRLEFDCHWNGLPETNSWLVRGLRRVFGRFSADPPKLIGVADRDVFEDVLAGFRTLQSKLDYDYTIHD